MSTRVEGRPALGMPSRASSRYLTRCRYEFLKTQPSFRYWLNPPCSFSNQPKLSHLTLPVRKNETTGGLCVMPGSQFRHDEVIQFNTGTRDFVTVQPYFPGFHDMPRKLVSCKAGDLVLWDSRTIHCNTPAPKPLPPKAKGLFRLPAPELLRACAYICITPRRMASAEVLRLRRCAFEAQITTSHWPHEVYLGSAGDENKPKLDINSCGQARRLLI